MKRCRKQIIAVLLALLMLPVLGQATMMTVDFGAHQDYMSYDGGKKHSAFTLPSFGFSFGPSEPGWGFRTRLSASNRDFEISTPDDSKYEPHNSSSLRIVMGGQLIMETGLKDFYWFFYTGLSYRISEVKVKYLDYGSGEGLVFGYQRFVRFSVPASLGVFYKLNKSWVFSMELEGDLIPLYSSYSEHFYPRDSSGTIKNFNQYETKNESWYNELGFGLYLNIGFLF